MTHADIFVLATDSVGRRPQVPAGSSGWWFGPHWCGVFTVPCSQLCGVCVCVCHSGLAAAVLQFISQCRWKAVRVRPVHAQLGGEPTSPQVPSFACFPELPVLPPPSSSFWAPARRLGLSSAPLQAGRTARGAVNGAVSCSPGTGEEESTVPSGVPAPAGLPGGWRARKQRTAPPPRFSPLSVKVRAPCPAVQATRRGSPGPLSVPTCAHLRLRAA